MLAILISAVILDVDPVAACEARLLSYAGWTETPATVWNLDLTTASGGRLTYLGAEHSRDPENAQFARISAAFVEAAPTLAFYEGPDRGEGADGADTIRTKGESGYVRWLAQQAGIRTAPLEPDPLDLFRLLARRYPEDQVALFFVLREAARLRDREGLQSEALTAAMATLMGRLDAMARNAALPLPFNDIAGLEAAYARYWTDGSDWRAAPSAWFDPAADDAVTGGRFMATINAASSEARNVHMYRVLSEATRAGERAFAVVGRNHVPMQVDALRCALETP